MKDALSGKLMTEFTALIPKTCKYLIDDGDENKKATGTKKCFIKRKLKIEHCFEATQVKIKWKNLARNKLDADSIWKNHKEFIKTIY